MTIKISIGMGLLVCVLKDGEGCQRPTQVRRYDAKSNERCYNVNTTKHTMWGKLGIKAGISEEGEYGRTIILSEALTFFFFWMHDSLQIVNQVYKAKAPNEVLVCLMGHQHRYI